MSKPERGGTNISGVPKFRWLEPDRVATDAIRDFNRRVSVSIPAIQYKALATLARVARRH